MIFLNEDISASEIWSPELPEQLKLQGKSDQQLRRPPADPARCPWLTRAVDCGQTSTTKTMTATKTRRRPWASTLFLTLLQLWHSFNLIVSFLGVLLQSNSFFVIVVVSKLLNTEKGTFPHLYEWDEKKLTLSRIRIPSRRTTQLDEFFKIVEVCSLPELVQCP